MIFWRLVQQHWYMEQETREAIWWKEKILWKCINPAFQHKGKQAQAAVKLLMCCQWNQNHYEELSHGDSCLCKHPIDRQDCCTVQSNLSTSNGHFKATEHCLCQQYSRPSGTPQCAISFYSLNIMPLIFIMLPKALIKELMISGFSKDSQCRGWR